MVIIAFYTAELYYSGKPPTVSNGYEEDEKLSRSDLLKNPNGREILPPPPPTPRKNHIDPKDRHVPAAVRKQEEDIFVGDGVDYSIPGKDMTQSPISEDMEESPRNKDRTSYFTEPAYGPVPPSELSHGWQQTVSALGFSFA